MDLTVNFTLVVEVFVTLFVIMDPVGTVPIFMSLTAGRSQPMIRKAAWQAVSVSFSVIVLFALFGQAILNYLGITLPAMQASGGLLLLIVALELLSGSEDKPMTGDASKNVALVPLGTPLMAGPGAIVATMLFVGRIDEVGDGIAVALGIIGVHAALWLAMRFSIPLQRLLKESGILLLTKIAGLLLAAIAVQMVANAVRAFIAAG